MSVLRSCGGRAHDRVAVSSPCRSGRASQIYLGVNCRMSVFRLRESTEVVVCMKDDEEKRRTTIRFDETVRATSYKYELYTRARQGIMVHIMHDGRHIVLTVRTPTADHPSISTRNTTPQTQKPNRGTPSIVAPSAGKLLTKSASRRPPRY